MQTICSIYTVCDANIRAKDGSLYTYSWKAKRGNSASGNFACFILQSCFGIFWCILLCQSSQCGCVRLRRTEIAAEYHVLKIIHTSNAECLNSFYVPILHVTTKHPVLGQEIPYKILIILTQ